MQAIAWEVLRLEDEAPGSVLDRDFLREHTEGFDAFREALRAAPIDDLVRESGVSRAEIREAARRYARAERTIVCWAMGLTQHRHAVANVREMVGHGIGSAFHEDPQVPNYGKPKRGARLAPGMTIAIEPMLNIGNHEIRTLPDKWTVVTKDASLSAHFEHTVAIGKNGDGPRILTQVE